ncbi:MAG: hypothetical protein ABIP63_01045 [Thermoanaerobaculia bacterium]
MKAHWDPRQLTEPVPASRRFVVCITSAYLLIAGFVAWHHEMWRDEADGWLFARDGNFLRIVDWSRHAGTPTLWYFLVAPLARIGLPAQCQQILHLAIAGAAVAVLLACAPFSRLTKILIAASYFFSYEYSVIVRSYALAILLAFTIAALWPSRRDRPLTIGFVLFLLFNVNAQGFAFAAAFSVLFAAEALSEQTLRGRRAIAVLAMTCGALISWLQVRTPPDPARQGPLYLFNADAFSWLIGNAWFPGASYGVAAFLCGLIILLAVTAVLRSRDAVFLLWIPIALLGVLHSWVWLGGLRHAGFFLIAALLALWIDGTRRMNSPPTRTGEVKKVRLQEGARPAAALLLNAALLFSTTTAIRYWIADSQASFSGAREMASFIRSHHIDRDPIAAHNLTQCEALLPYLPATAFWYAGLQHEGTYMTWDAAMERALDVPYPVAEARSRTHFLGKRWTLLLNVEMPAPETHGYRLLFANQIPVFEKRDERYWLYQPLHLGPMTSGGRVR